MIVLLGIIAALLVVLGVAIWLLVKQGDRIEELQYALHSDGFAMRRAEIHIESWGKIRSSKDVCEELVSRMDSNRKLLKGYC